jgi:hypothetical protein
MIKVGLKSNIVVNFYLLCRQYETIKKKSALFIEPAKMERGNILYTVEPVEHQLYSDV